MPKAFFERIEPAPGTSFACKHFRAQSFPFCWHFHPEIELTLIVRGRGRRFVGDSIAPFAQSDLVLLGSNLPHTWRSTDGRSTDEPNHAGRRPAPGKACEAIVVQFRPDFLRDLLVSPVNEMRGIVDLIQRARRGLQFLGTVRDQTAEALLTLEALSPLRRLTQLLELLDTLARDREARSLSSPGFRPAVTNLDQKRITHVCGLLNREFTRTIKLAEAADLANLSASAFSRFFLRTTGKHFTEYLTELRIGRTCERLIETEEKISAIAHESGFENLSHFNRAFRHAKAMTPREFRSAHAGSAPSIS